MILCKLPVLPYWLAIPIVRFKGCLCSLFFLFSLSLSLFFFFERVNLWFLTVWWFEPALYIRIAQKRIFRYVFTGPTVELLIPCTKASRCLGVAKSSLCNSNLDSWGRILHQVLLDTERRAGIASLSSRTWTNRGTPSGVRKLVNKSI